MDPSPSLDTLRRTVRALEAAGRGAGASLEGPHGTGPCLATGAPSFDAALGGGLALAGVSQIRPVAHGDEPAAIAFATACAACALEARAGALVIVADGAAVREWGRFDGPGLQALGIGVDRVILVDAPDARAARACLEDAARTPGLAGVLALMGAKTGFDLVAARRVQLAAEEGGGLVLLVGGVRSGVFAPARARLAVAARPSRVPDWWGGGVPGLALPPLGPPAWRVRLERVRAATPLTTFDLEYDHATHRLHQPAPLADRPAAPHAPPPRLRSA